MAFLQRDGYVIHYEVHEDLCAEPTLFLHGNLASNRWWLPAVAALKRRRQETGALPGKAILVEWRGCGQSRPLKEGESLSLSELAEDVVALASLCDGAANLVSHSTGGLIALAAMAARPPLFRRALLAGRCPPQGSP